MMKQIKTTANARLIIFSKYPVPGKAKTRLIPLLGPAGAADLQKGLTEKMVDTARRFAQSHPIAIIVSFEGGSIKKMKAWLGNGLVYACQAPGDIGLRMHHAMSNAFLSGSGPVVLIGTDIPDITEAVLVKAFSSLKNNDLVLGPSTDGGYWLIGLNHPVNLFHDIQWSTCGVLEQTLHLANNHGLKYHLLNPLTDIDTEKSLKKWKPELAEHTPYMSIIIPAVDEADTIAAAIQSAANTDSELIVVDGGSTDTTIEKAKQMGAIVITGPKGRAKQQNVGAKRALGKVLLFLHADTLLPKNYLAYVFDTLMDGRVVAGAFKFKTDFSHPFMRIIELGTHIRSKYFHLPYGDQALFLNKSCFESIGGFPDVAIAEDLFLAKKLSAAGKIRMVPFPIITSGRRWKIRGPVRTWLINTIILAGCKMGVSPQRLKSLYRTPKSKP